ncbi:MAG TPA: hypothetical protein V6C58_25920, partial [Allocoleopsis sp.]
SFGVKGGVNRFLNNEISARGTLGFLYHFNKNKFNEYNNNSLTLNISNGNFINIGKLGNDSLVLTQKNRQMLEFNASLGVFFGDIEPNLSLSFSTNYAYFILKNLALGANFSYSESNQNKLINFQPYAQYFIPIAPSLYATTAARFQFYNDGNLSSNYASAQAGLSYFLSQYVMLDCVLINYNRIQDNNQWIFGPSVGVKSFLK